MQPVIETKAVSKIYQTGNTLIKAVDRADLTIYKGEFVALVGPSGSGKTTMLAIIAALLNPSEGEVFIKGRDLSKMSEKERLKLRRRQIGFTFQSNNLVPYLTVQENIELMLRINGGLKEECRQRTIDIMHKLGISEQRGKLPNQLSGGQKQRVSIARSLIHNPSVVLADEPTASLDTERAYQVVNAFADLIHEENKAGIMVTHDLRMVQFVDRVIQMRDGRIDAVLNSKEEICAFVACDQIEDVKKPEPAADGADGAANMTASTLAA